MSRKTWSKPMLYPARGFAGTWGETLIRALVREVRRSVRLAECLDWAAGYIERITPKS